MTDGRHDTVSGGQAIWVRHTETPHARSLQGRNHAGTTHARTTLSHPASGPSKTVLPALFAIALIAGALPAQLPALPAQSYYAIGKIDWTMPCGPWSVNTELSAAPWDRQLDPGYPGTQATYSCRVGGIFYIRGLQHDAICPDYLPLGATIPPLFLFGPRSNAFIQINLPNVFPGQNVVFSNTASPISATHYGPWEFDPTVDCWAAQIMVPNSPQLSGTEWEAQAAFVSLASGKVHFGISRYTRIM